MRVLKTVPASAFCEKATQTDAVAATVDVMASGLMRSLSERLAALEKKSAANDAKIAANAAARAANREKIERLEKKSAANDAARAANRAEIERLKRKSAADDAGRAANRAALAANHVEIANLKAWLDDWRNSTIIVTRFREVSRTVMAFFNVIYATWVQNHPRPWKYANTVFLDKVGCPLNEDCGQDEDSARHRRAVDFLRDMWSGFGGIDMDVGTWNSLRAFIRNTNEACHAIPASEMGNTVESIVARERAAPPRLDRDATTKMLNTIMPLIATFGNGKWSTRKPRPANDKAFENRSRFKKFPAWWPR